MTVTDVGRSEVSIEADDRPVLALLAAPGTTSRAVPLLGLLGIHARVVSWHRRGELIPDAVLATCASVEGIEELFAVTSAPGRVIGLSFFPPVYAASQVQVTIGSQTERLTAERVLHFVTVLDKKAVVQGRLRNQA